MSSVLTCPECATPFAVDQRYCTECGCRVRALPHYIAVRLAAMSGALRLGPDRLSSTAGEAGGAASPTRGPRLMLFGQPLELPSPRVMAVAVMALLAFGVIVGTNSFSLAASPLQVTVNRAAAAAAAAAAPSAPAARPVSSPSASSAPAAGGTTAPASTPPSSATSASASVPSSSSSAADSSTSPGTTTTPASSTGLPPIKHVWVIQLGDQGYANTFNSTSSDTYLNKTLASQGEVVPNVYASATSDLANEIGLISGQGPTVQTENDCPTYTAVTPGTVGADGQVSGDGCVYPYSTTSFESELSAAGDSWKAYVQGQGILPATSCIHPDLAAADTHFAPTSTGGYVTWRNPLVYLTDVTEGGCTYQDTGLTKLKSDLSEAATTPDVSFIYANPCDDGSDAPCLPGAASGTTESDAFLKSVVPEITQSAAYKADGMILITFAQAPQSGTDADHSSCCDQPAQFPNLPSADYEPSATMTGTGTSTTPTGTDTTGTGTTGTDTTGTGTGTGGTATSTATTTTTPGFNTATISGPIITIPGVSGTLGTTTSPQGLITGTDPTVAAGTSTPTGGPDTTAAGTGTTSTSGTTTTPCPTSTTGTDTTNSTTTGFTTTDSTTTETVTTGTGTTGTSTIASDDCCPTDTATGTTAGATATSTGTTSPDATDTGTTTTPGCSTSSPSTSASPTGGGGQVGMLVLSKFVTPNLPDGVDDFNTFSITASLEQLFSLKLTGYASTTGLPVFSSFLYSAYNSG